MRETAYLSSKNIKMLELLKVCIRLYPAWLMAKYSARHVFRACSLSHTFCISFTQKSLSFVGIPFFQIIKNIPAYLGDVTKVYAFIWI